MLRGLIVAPHSPFTGEGELNLAVVEAYARHLVAHNVAGAFICGSTGEGYSLTVEERKCLAARWCEAATGRLRVIVHVGSLRLAHSQELAAHAESVGADAIATEPQCHPRPLSPHASSSQRAASTERTAYSPMCAASRTPATRAPVFPPAPPAPAPARTALPASPGRCWCVALSRHRSRAAR